MTHRKGHWIYITPEDVWVLQLYLIPLLESIPHTADGEIISRKPLLLELYELLTKSSESSFCNFLFHNFFILDEDFWNLNVYHLFMTWGWNSTCSHLLSVHTLWVVLNVTWYIWPRALNMQGLSILFCEGKGISQVGHWLRSQALQRAHLAQPTLEPLVLVEVVASNVP